MALPIDLINPQTLSNMLEKSPKKFPIALKKFVKYFPIAAKNFIAVLRTVPKNVFAVEAKLDKALVILLIEFSAFPFPFTKFLKFHKKSPIEDDAPNIISLRNLNAGPKIFPTIFAVCLTIYNTVSIAANSPLNVLFNLSAVSSVIISLDVKFLKLSTKLYILSESNPNTSLKADLIESTTFIRPSRAFLKPSINRSRPDILLKLSAKSFTDNSPF